MLVRILLKSLTHTGTIGFNKGTYTVLGTGDEETAAGDLEWRVLGLNQNGQIELISTTPTVNTLVMYGREGYDNAVSELNNFCDSLYGNGYGAEKARSLDANDIYKLAKTTAPASKTYTFIYYEKDNYNIWYKSGSHEYPTDISTWDCCYSSYMQNGMDLREFSLDADSVGPEEFTEISHSCNMSKELNYTTNNGINMFDFISKGEGKKDNTYQFLASNQKFFEFNPIYVDYAVSYLRETNISSVSIHGYGNGSGHEFASSLFVRPVVTLNSNVSFELSSDGTTYDIK